VRREVFSFLVEGAAVIELGVECGGTYSCNGAIVEMKPEWGKFQQLDGTWEAVEIPHVLGSGVYSGTLQGSTLTFGTAERVPERTIQLLENSGVNSAIAGVRVYQK
jgi:hypothetical protein